MLSKVARGQARADTPPAVGGGDGLSVRSYPFGAASPTRGGEPPLRV